MRMNSQIPALALITGLLVFGCGRRDAETGSADTAAAGDTVALAETSDDTATHASTEERPAEPADAGSRPVTVEDIDRWRQGMEGEIKAVQATVAKMKTAQASEKATLMMEATEQSTAAAGAEAAGLDEERYRFVRAELSDVVKYLTPPELEGFDTTKMPQSARDEFRASQEANLKRTAEAVPSDVVEALKPRALELRKKNLELVGARLKAAEMR